jgi:hypothetical protein
VGAQTLMNLQATITTATPGVEILDGTAAYPDIAPGGTAGALSPYFTIKVGAGIACGTTIAFNVEMTGTGGSWGGFFTQKVGGNAPISTTALNESFSSGIPATWTVVDSGFGTGPAATWTTANPGGRTFTPPLSNPVAIVDSNAAGPSNSQDEHLITAPVNLSAYSQVTLHFDHYFHWLSGNNNERADVDVSSSISGGFVNVERYNGADFQGHRAINISAQAAGGTDVKVRFRYYLGQNEWWWQVDNVRLEASGQACTMSACAAPAAPKPVTGMLASRAAADGSVLDVTWSASCSSPQNQILYGSLGSLSSYAVDGSVCGIGTSGSKSWTGVPAGDLWFVVVGSDGSGTEGSWGTGPGGAPRKGGDASGQCGNVFRNNGGSCP